MENYRLGTPGPSMAPPEVLLELAKPIRHHRTAENKALVAETIANLKKVFCTENDVLILTSSGTGALEAAVANVVAPGDKVIALTAGKFGERWVALGKAFQANVVVIEEPYGKAIAPERVADALKQHPDAVAVLATLSETSTGVVHDVEGYAEIVAKTPALLVIDGISGVGACPCKVDEWGIDLLCVGSQKALMLPPGLAFLTVSPKAKKVIEAKARPFTFYFDVRKALKSAADNDTPWTPAHTLIAAQAQALRLIVAEGIENVWKRTASMSRAMLAAVEALGLMPFAERPGSALTAITAPEGIDGDKWAKLLEKKYGLKVAGGQGTMKGKIIRISHMGYVDELDVVGMVAAMEWSLAELGYPVESGRAVAAATRSLAHDLVPAPAAVG